MDDTTRLLVDLVCEAYGLTRAEFMEIVKEEADEMGLTIREEALV